VDSHFCLSGHYCASILSDAIVRHIVVVVAVDWFSAAQKGWTALI